jgi:hypothetical protein
MAEPILLSAPSRSPARRLFFRFAFSYFLIYGVEISLPVFPGGGGDRTADYLQVVWTWVVAALAALAWTWLDRHRRHSSRDGALDEIFRLNLRYALLFLLLAYGMSKVIPVEFPFPSIARLQERIGDSSPFTLYSVFMGYSAPYTFFTGAAAVVAGLLLLSRRTTTLGALLVLGVLGNEAMLAFSYDVPTKLLSLHGLGMALLLLAPDLRRLADGLLFDRPTRPADLGPPIDGAFASKRGRLGRWGLQAVVVLYALWATTQPNLDLLRERRLASQPPLYGAYEVEQFLRNGQTVPDFRDLTRWQRLIVTSPKELTVSLVNGSRRSFSTAYAGQSVVLSPPQGALTYARPDPEHLLLQGTLGGDALRLTLRRIDGSQYLLVSRKLHVIDDEPLNQ